MFEDDDKKLENDETKKDTPPIVPDDQEEAETSQDDGNNESDASQEEKPEKTAKDKTPPWMQRRINKEVAEKHALRRENEELKKKLNETSPDEKPAKENLTEEEIDRRAEIKAARRDFDRACNRTYDAAVAEFSDFPTKLNDLKQNVGELPFAVIEVINELEGGHKVLHHLATDFEEAARIYELPPAKMAIELAKISDKLLRTKPKPISKAPPPVEPVSGGKKIADGLADSLSDEEWIRRRNEQRRKAGKM